MHRQDELWVCTYDSGERVRTELDRGNARQRPFTIKPVPHPKPLDHYYPNTLETDDAAVFNFLSRQVEARVRYERIDSGSAAYLTAGGALPALSWAARYFYDLIQENDQHRRVLIPRAKELLGQIADFLSTRQEISPLVTRANDAFYGGFLGSGIGATWITDDTATCGLAMLYAYRVLGTPDYLDRARAAASYLRNVQAIGSHGTNYTSTDATGVGRLYTGSLASEVANASGFYSNSLFYPSALLTLEFWNELKTTDGDQNVGSPATPTGFSSIPMQLLSESITDLRTCWEVGITDATGTIVNGLTSTTPKEVFNAFPTVKPNFTTVVGTGMWEYADGNADNGTQISSQNFCLALSSLYNYEGATSQVTTISDWLRSFTSNPDFETPDDTSTSDLYRSTTGTYDPTVTIATLLQVRSPVDFSDTKINASSVYDWGAFGLLSRLWASRNTGSFRMSRLFPLNTVQRYYDGNATDGNNTDRVILRGISGLSMQTGFATYSTTFGEFESISTTPDEVNLVYRYEADSGITKNGSNQVSDQTDITAHGWDIHTPAGGNIPPTWVADAVGGQPALYFANPNTGPGDWSLAHYGGPFYAGAPAAFPVDTPYTYTQNQPHVVYAVVRPTVAPPGGGVAGGMISLDRNGFSRQLWTLGANQQRVARSGATILYVDPAVDYTNQTLLITYRWDGTDMFVTVNGNPLLTRDLGSGLPSSTLPAVADGGTAHTIMVGGSTVDQSGFGGYIAAVLLATDTAVSQTTISYLAGKYGSPVAGITNDAVRAAQFGRSFRESRS